MKVTFVKLKYSRVRKDLKMCGHFRQYTQRKCREWECDRQWQQGQRGISVLRFLQRVYGNIRLQENATKMWTARWQHCEGGQHKASTLLEEDAAFICCNYHSIRFNFRLRAVGGCCVKEFTSQNNLWIAVWMFCCSRCIKIYEQRSNRQLDCMKGEIIGLFFWEKLQRKQY